MKQKHLLKAKCHVASVFSLSEKCVTTSMLSGTLFRKDLPKRTTFSGKVNNRQNNANVKRVECVQRFFVERPRTMGLRNNAGVYI